MVWHRKRQVVLRVVLCDLMLLQIVLVSVIHFDAYHTHFAKCIFDTLSTFSYPRVFERPFILILACISLFLLWWFILPFCHDQVLLVLFYRDLLLALRTSKWRRSRFTLRNTQIDIGQIARCVDTQRAQSLRNSTNYRQK